MYEIKGHEIPTDDDGRVNLTEIWRLAGRPANRKPSSFKRLKRVREVLSMAQWLARRGRLASSWAHHYVATLYADYAGLGLAQSQPSAADQDWAEIHRLIDELKQAREQAAAEQAARAREQAEDSWPDPEDAQVFAGEEWKGADYNPDMAGEEWKGDANRAADGRGPDDLFMDFINIPGFLTMRSSIN